VIDGTPASRAGLLAGDQVLRIDDQPTRQMMDYIQKMRGKRGAQVSLTVQRSGWKEPRSFVMVRDIIRIRSVEGFLLEPGYGVLRVKQFTDNLDREVELQLAAMERESGGKLSGLVLDLRNNPGGLLDQAVRLADIFIEHGLIVRTEGRGGRILDEERARPEGTRTSFPIICLVNGGSASAAEIVAGALQDHGRALVMGTQTYGKGSVQTIVELEDGSALKLTIARYYTPSGRSIQEKGITPDVVVDQVRLSDGKSVVKDEPSQKERDLQGHLKNRQKPGQEAGPPPGYSVIAQRTPQGEDFQLRTAYDYLKAWHLFATRLLHRGPRPESSHPGSKGSAATEQPQRPVGDRALRNDTKVE
jgi:carboxyl-terminal processing protease